jgi:hypothetical protein
MPSAMTLRTVFAAGRLRQLLKKAKEVTQSWRLLTVAAALDGGNRAEAAMMGGVDRQSLLDGIHRLSAAGRDGPLEIRASGIAARLSAAKQASVTKFVEIGPHRGADRIRWPYIDHECVIAERSASIITSTASKRFSENSASRTSAGDCVIWPRIPMQSREPTFRESRLRPIRQ